MGLKILKASLINVCFLKMGIKNKSKIRKEIHFGYKIGLHSI